MSEKKANILWIDDEIDLLRPHVLYLNDKGFVVKTATNGEDAIEMVKNQPFDLVFLDEMMAGMGGLETLAEIKRVRPNLPVIMITKNEAESLMEEAIGGKISDYLTKPVNPSQVLLTCKKFLEGKKITSEHVSRDYVQEFQKITAALMSAPGYNDWVDIYRKLTEWEIELDDHPELGLRQTLNDQKREC
ncbi:MAG: response regulator, partial [Bacteroidota bacterium]